MLVNGLEWKKFAVHFNSPTGKYQVEVYARCANHAEEQVEHLRESAVVVGEIVHEEPVEPTYTIKGHEVAVATDYFWQPIDSCPRGVKVQLLGAGGVAVYGIFDKSDFWRGWAPAPKVRT